MSAVTKRLYVGNVFQDADACLEELRTRFARFGRCLSEDFEKHGTFAYMNMEFNDDAQFQRLRNSFNNVKFKGNELRVSAAKPDWQSAWEARHKQDEEQCEVLNKVAEKRNWEYHKKMENIGMSWEERKNVIPGRVRETPRSKAQMRNITFRLNVNGSLKVYKCYKTKLWGYEREKDAKDLVSRFVNNKWRNGEDHIVDRLDYSRARRSVSAKVEEQREDLDLMAETEEPEKVKDVLAGFLKDFEFDKPLQLSDDEGTEIPFQQESNVDHSKEIGKAVEMDEDSTSQSNEVRDAASEEQVDENEEQVEENEEQVDENEEQVDENEDEDEEFIPTFASGASGASVENTKASDEKPESNTETLRNLFNPESDEPASSFRLIAHSDEDIDHQMDLEVEEVTATPQEIQIMQKPVQEKEKHHLFFPHFDSPFLVGQTMLSKLKTSDVTEKLSDWEDKFWENRGNWTKELKRKRRDALRHSNKKRVGKGSGLLL